MNTSILTTLMLSVGVLMFMLPFFIFITLGGSIAAVPGDARLLVALLLSGAVLMYLVSAGAFTLIQNYNCGKVKSAGKIASNAGTATGIYAAFVALAAFIPKLRSIVTDIISPEVEQNVRDSLGYGYYSFWGSLFGIAIGGTMSAVCAA
jgi:hypothetical protein